MNLVGNGASAAHDAAAPKPESVVNQCFLPTARGSSFDVAGSSVLINVQMDSTVQDYKENNAAKS